MPTTFLPYLPDQSLLLPASLTEWLPEDHLAYFISDSVDAPGLEAFYARYEGDGRRRQPFDPRMMVKVLVYGYASGGVLLAQDCQEAAGGRGVSGAGSEQLSGAWHDPGVSAAALGGVVGAVCSSGEVDAGSGADQAGSAGRGDRKSTRLNSSH